MRFEDHLWPKLLELMARHDLVYRLSEDEWVVPQSVPDRVPEPLPWTANGRRSASIAGSITHLRVDGVSHRSQPLQAREGAAPVLAARRILEAILSPARKRLSQWMVSRPSAWRRAGRKATS